MNGTDSLGFLVLKTLAFQLEFAVASNLAWWKSHLYGFLGGKPIKEMTLLYLVIPCMLT